ncbi:Ribosomal protein L26 [Giardia muris]|uniref:Ribosomal protein L26 n=1 Tax=Giardia muris TaxID=5742 RepID=A0A4Z1SSY4_GIAMU|nr:Ribosomal protein L26 [Giardia muris]|eukprot:TNJ26758.1 Ribosomal protein L26 [Giardia muris]
MKLNPAVTSSRRKCRKAYFTASSAERAKVMSSRLSKELREKHGVKTMPIRKGDVVKIMCGSHKTTTGKVTEVRRRDYKVIIEGVNQKSHNASARAAPYPIHPSNCIIQELSLDENRQKIINRRSKK